MKIFAIVCLFAGSAFGQWKQNDCYVLRLTHEADKIRYKTLPVKNLQDVLSVASYCLNSENVTVTDQQAYLTVLAKASLEIGTRETDFLGRHHLMLKFEAEDKAKRE